MVGDDQVRRSRRQMLRALHPQAKKQHGECAGQAMQQRERDALRSGGRRQPFRLVLRQHRRHVDFHCIRRRRLLDEPQQIAHLRHPGEILLGHPDAENAFQLETEVQPFERIDAEVELGVAVQRQAARGIARLQDFATPPLLSARPAAPDRPRTAASRRAGHGLRAPRRTAAAAGSAGTCRVGCAAAADARRRNRTGARGSGGPARPRRGLPAPPLPLPDWGRSGSPIRPARRSRPARRGARAPRFHE